MTLAPIVRGDILLLGITAGVAGSLTGGILLGLGIYLITAGSTIGWLVMLPGAPIAALPGYLLATRLAAQLPTA
jgi:hypothetical protein